MFGALQFSRGQASAFMLLAFRVRTKIILKCSFHERTTLCTRHKQARPRRGGVEVVGKKMPPPRAPAIFFGHAPLPLCLWRGSMGSVSPCATDQNMPDPDAYIIQPVIKPARTHSPHSPQDHEPTTHTTHTTHTTRPSPPYPHCKPSCEPNNTRVHRYL